MTTEFHPIFVFIVFAIFGVATVMLILSALLGPRRSTPVKQMPYESGMDPVGDARQRFDVRYYLVAIAFLLFDVELLYLYPWAVAQWSADAPNPVAAAQDDEAVVVTAATVETADPAAKPVPAAAVAVVAKPVPAVIDPDEIAPVPVEAGIGVGIPPAFRTMVFLEILVFIAVLTAAYAYAWRKGVFEWR